MKRPLLWLTTLGLAVAVSVAGTIYFFSATKGRRTLVVSTTTSLYDTGLLEVVKERFEEENPIELYFISVGSGLAIQHATRGDADLVLVHAPSLERDFLEEGYGVCRKVIAYNFFVIVGPDADPLRIWKLNVSEALTRIVKMGRDGNATWVSRGDESGTHIKEMELWADAGFNWTQLKEERWFLNTGSGMGYTLLVTNQKAAYTLADMGTYLQYSRNNRISLKVLIEADGRLLNVYSVIAVNPDKVSRANFEDAIVFIKFLTSIEGQNLIESYRKKDYGSSLFSPAVNLLKTDSNPTIAQWIRDYAFINGTECPPEYRGRHPELY